MLDAVQAPEGQDAARKRQSSNQINSKSTRYATHQKKCKGHQGKRRRTSSKDGAGACAQPAESSSEAELASVPLTLGILLFT